MSWMTGSSDPVMYWAVCITLCRAMLSRMVLLPYQAVMQPVKMLSMAQLYNLLRI